MTPLGRFLGGLVSTSIGKAFVVVLGLAGLMVATRAVSPADLGIYVLLLAAVVFLTEFSAGGIGLAVAQRLVKGLSAPEERNVVGTAFTFRLVSSAAVGLTAYFASGPLFTLFGGASDDIAQALAYLPVLVVIESLAKLSTSVLEGKFRFTAIGLAGIIGSVASFSSIVLFVVVLQLGLLGLLLAKLLSRLIALVYCLWAARVRPTPRFDRQVLQELLRFGFPLQLNFVLSFVFSRADTFLISVLLGPAQVAFYEIARRIPDSVSDAYEAFVQVYFPSVAQRIESGDLGGATEMMTTSARWIAFGALFVALGATLFGYDIIVLLFTATYVPSVAAFYLLCVSLAAYLVDSTLGYGLIAAGQGGKIPIFNSIRAAAAFMLYFLFIERWGLQGAAAGSILSVMLVMPLNVVFLRRRGLSVRWLAVVRPFAVYAAFAAVALVVGPLGLLAKLGLLVVYAGAALAFGVITPDDLRAARREFARVASGRKAKVSTGAT